MDSLKYIVWNPANVKFYSGKDKAALLKPNRNTRPPAIIGKANIKVNTPMSRVL